MPSNADLPGWKFHWSDDFLGSKLNHTVWGEYNGQPGGDPEAWWATSHVFVSNGKLVLSTYKDSVADPSGRWVSGGVGGHSIMSQTYGKYLVRYRMDIGKGVSGILLLWPVADIWPPEIDFVEDGDGSRTSSSATLHWGSSNHQQQVSHNADFSLWHTLGVEWTPGRLVFTMDNGVWGVINNTNVPDIPHSLDAQAQVCNGPNCPDGTTPSVVNLEIDWVVTYYYAPGGTVVGGDPGANYTTGLVTTVSPTSSSSTQEAAVNYSAKLQAGIWSFALTLLIALFML